MWGFLSKAISGDVDAQTNQIYFTIGLLPLIVLMWGAMRTDVSRRRAAGVRWALLTGILGGLGNVAFFEALVIGGKASIVIPITALYPVVTVALALAFLRERLGNLQKIGLVVAIVALVVLSLPS
jgi:bacterial/archaeal transporter family protein